MAKPSLFCAGLAALWLLLLPALVVGVRPTAASLDAPVPLALDRWHRPHFCHRLDCPRFKTQKEKCEPEYEVRRYESGAPPPSPCLRGACAGVKGTAFCRA